MGTFLLCNVSDLPNTTTRVGYQCGQMDINITYPVRY